MANFNRGAFPSFRDNSSRLEDMASAYDADRAKLSDELGICPDKSLSNADLREMGPTLKPATWPYCKTCKPPGKGDDPTENQPHLDASTRHELEEQERRAEEGMEMARRTFEHNALRW